MLSVKDRRERNAIRKQLIEDGILPKPSPKRNYNTYLRQVEEMREEKDPNIFELAEALMTFYPNHIKQKSCKFTDVEKAAIKIVHFAVEKAKFIERLKYYGKTQYSVGELYEEVYVKVFPKREYNHKGEKEEVKNDN